MRFTMLQKSMRRASISITLDNTNLIYYIISWKVIALILIVVDPTLYLI